MSENTKTLAFVTAMCVVVALALTGLRQATLPIAKANEALFNRQAMLSSLGDNLTVGGTPVADAQSMPKADVDAIFGNAKTLQQFALDMEGNVLEGVKAEDVDMEAEEKKDEADRRLPLFVYTNETGKKFYIIAVRGNGLWDKIWGNIALTEDLKTVAGVAFDHKGETPGLGAEIKDNKDWKNLFNGKSIFTADGSVALNVRKGGAQDKMYDVDGLSGATVTGNGVTEMLQRGIGYYEPYFKTLKK